MRIAVIIGSTRPGRVGEGVARWVHAHAAGRGDAEFDLIDLKDYGLGLLDEATVPGAASRQYENPATRRWSASVDSYDGFIFVTPEYNHGVPAALKNAVDVLYPEWNHKTVAFVGYGVDGGVRAVEQWRAITANLLMQAVRAQLSLSVFLDFDGPTFTPIERRVAELDTVLGQLVALTAAVSALRS
jgi:NAD(P)H-dependent FMN reductase